jgi:hypothetical protein
MHGWPETRVRALLLALFLVLGSSLAVVHGSLMAAEQAVLADAGHPAHSDCEGCDDGDDCTTDAGTCLSLCASAALCLLPAEPIAWPPTSEETVDAGRLIPGGCSNRPEPGPPKLLAPARA